MVIAGPTGAGAAGFSRPNRSVPIEAKHRAVRAFFIPDTYLPQAQGASGERLARRIGAGIRDGGGPKVIAFGIVG